MINFRPMGGDEAEQVALEFFQSLEGHSERALEQLAEDVVINPANGHIHVGHEGYVHWCEELATDREGRLDPPKEATVVRANWVLMKGAVEESAGAGPAPTERGCWLVQVREGLIAAILYYRTEQAAREALSEQQ